ncbi:MAG: hypothetical protein PHC75_06335 [Burkholderiales bacterium]|nr:hypothetical protein [Burkholderiales bacterium]
MSNILQNYPNHKAFEELLNSCGSMTRQLETIGHKLTVKLLKEGLIEDNFCRYTLLKLDNNPVILALSYTKNNNLTFIEILKNANNIPIGKFLFAKSSGISRDSLVISKITLDELSDSLISNYLKTHYHDKQEMFSRKSEFISVQNEKMILIEIILPELKKLFK